MILTNREWMNCLRKFIGREVFIMHDIIEVEKALLSLKEAIHNVLISAAEAWESIKELMGTTLENIKEIDRENVYRSSWHVPKKIIRNHQVIIRKPMVANIRSNL